MTVKELLVADLKATLEETANLMADRIILESLAKNGKITLEEAEFYDSLVRRVITEAADEFVPDSLPEPEAAEPMILTGEDGTVYQFNPATCELIPVEGAEGSEPEEGLDEVPAEGDEEVQLGESTEETQEQVEESETQEVEKTQEQLEESETQEVQETQEELTESQQIVANLIKSLGA